MDQHIEESKICYGFVYKAYMHPVMENTVTKQCSIITVDILFYTGLYLG